MNLIFNVFDTPVEGELNIYIRTTEDNVYIDMAKTIEREIGVRPEINSTNELEFQRSVNWYHLLEKFYTFFVSEFEKQINSPDGVPNFNGNAWENAIKDLNKTRADTRAIIISTAKTALFWNSIKSDEAFIVLGEKIDGKRTAQHYIGWLKSFWPF